MATDQRYQIINRLDAGGMAEVFKAKAVSMQGFEKVVAIKRILPNLTKDERFVRMFLDEARLALHLQHANVVQTFDIGQADGTYFIVMEFVEGANLKKILNALAKRGARLSIEEACFVAQEMCKGLTHAHDKKAPDGTHLRIVHRDISPPNVLISREGEVKVMDFGLAKASLQLEETDPGVVKGKFGYLSPEAAQGETVDVQTDVFAVGIVLWEMLAGKRLFLGNTDLDTLKLVRAAKIPPLRNENPNVPADLSTIVRRALALSKDERYPTAQDLHDDLSQFLFNRGRTVTNYDLSRIVTSIIDEDTKRQKTNTDLGNIDLLIQEEINKFISFEGDADATAHPGTGTASAFDQDTGDMTIVDSAASLMGGMDFEDPRTWGDAFGGGGDEGLSFENIPSAGLATSGGPSSSSAVPTRTDDPPTPNPSTAQQPAQNTQPAQGEEDGGSMKAAWIVLAILLIIALGLGGYLAVNALGGGAPADSPAPEEPAPDTPKEPTSEAPAPE